MSMKAGEGKISLKSGYDKFLRIDKTGYLSGVSLSGVANPEQFDVDPDSTRNSIGVLVLNFSSIHTLLSFSFFLQIGPKILDCNKVNKIILPGRIRVRYNEAFVAFYRKGIISAYNRAWVMK